MNIRDFPDFSDTMEWNLVARQTYNANVNAALQNRLPARQWFIQNSNLLIIGVRSSTARTYWKTGGWASQIQPFLPSTVSEFAAAVQSDRKWLQLGRMTLLTFPKLLSGWILNIDFPYWLDQVYVEIYRYDGRDYTTFERLATLEQKIDALMI